MKLFDIFNRSAAPVTPQPPPLPEKFTRLSSQQKRAMHQAAALDRVTVGMFTTVASADATIQGEGQTLCQRAQELERNNGYMRKHLDDSHKNIIGDCGYQFQSKVMLPDGTPNKAVNDQLEALWEEWCEEEYCSTTKRDHFSEVSRLVLRSFRRDGEVLIRKRYPFNHPFGYTLHMMEGAHLDWNYNHPFAANGVFISMGVEQTTDGEHIAYHILRDHPGAIMRQGEFYRERVPARDVIHLYRADRIGQSRGIPHASAVMRSMHNLVGYEDAELTASRAGACKMAAMTRTTLNGWSEEGEDAAGNLTDEAVPGSVIDLPPGMDMKAIDWNHPNAIYRDYRKGCLQGISSGLGQSYNMLASDLEGVSYSSIRSGVLDERMTWEDLQMFIKRKFFHSVYKDWLWFTLLSGRVPGFTIMDHKALNKPHFSMRTWDWVDPKNDMEAENLAVLHGYKSRRQVIIDMGGDPDAVTDEIADDQKKCMAKGLTFPGMPTYDLASEEPVIADEKPPTNDGPVPIATARNGHAAPST